MNHERRDRSQGSEEDLSSRDRRATDRLRLLEDLGDIYFSADAYPQAIEEYRRALSGPPTEKTFEIHLRIARCHHARGEYKEALDSLSRVEEESAPLLAPVARGKLLAMYGHTYRALGEYSKAKEACEEALEALRGTGEDQEIASVQLCYGAILHRLGQLDRAGRLYEDALSAYRQIDDQTGVAMAYNNLGLVYMNLCKWDRAAEYLVDAREIAEVLGNYSKVAVRTANLGIVRLHQGRWADAEECFRKSRRVYREIGYSRGMAKVCFELGRLERVRRHWRAARSLIEEGLRLAEQNGCRREMSVGHEFLGELCCETGRLGEAESHYSRGLEIAEAIAPQSDHISEICRRWAELCLKRNEPERALNLAERALATAIRIQDHLEEGLSHRALGLARERLGEGGHALEELKCAEEHLRRSEEPLELAKTLLRLGEFYIARPTEGSREKALEVLREAAATFDRLGDRFGTGSATLKMAEVLWTLGEADGCLDLLERASDMLGGARDERQLASVASLRGEVEKQLLADALSERNRLAPFARWVERRDSSAAGMLKAALQAASGDRGFVANVSEDGEIEIDAVVGLDRRRARALFENLLTKTDATGPTLVLDGAGGPEAAGSRAVKSFILLPLGGHFGGSRWVYLDRLAGGRMGRFEKRDVDFLVPFLEIACRQVGARPAPGSEASRERSVRCSTIDDVMTVNRTVRDILELVPRIGRSNISVLLRGETGTGKQLLAEAIHSASDRRERPFVTVSCAALPEGLLETELFGHLRGAFTGAVREKRGLIEEADGGTLFLDEIEKASVVVQGKLLHVLDSGDLRPVGSTQSRGVDIRVICATSKMDLETEISEGRFLNDLFYRLKDILLTIPPLRDRREDIPVLARHFLDLYGRRMGKRVHGIAPETMGLMERYSWPGNVRELEKAIKLALVLADEGAVITPDLLPAEVTCASPHRGPVEAARGSLREMVESMERREILETLERCRWNKSEAARVLGITRKGLANKIHRYGLKGR